MEYKNKIVLEFAKGGKTYGLILPEVTSHSELYQVGLELALDMLEQMKKTAESITPKEPTPVQADVINEPTPVANS